MSELVDNAARPSEGSAVRQALLAKWLQGRALDHAGGRGPSIPRRPERAPIPLSFEQSRLWFFYQLEPQSPLYTMPIGMRLSGALDPRALQQALDAIVARHEALRTRFPADAAAQVVAAPRAVPMCYADLRSAPPAAREVEARRILETEARRPFDLAGDLMIRVVLIRLYEEEWLFLVLMHHIASDDWSWRVICTELAEGYEAAVSGRPAALAEPALQYGDFAVWQCDSFRGDALKEHLAFWRGQLSGAPAVLELPTDHPRPAAQSFRGACESLILSLDFKEKIERLGHHAGATLFTTLLAAFQVLLLRYTGQETMLIASPVAGRTRGELENVIGVFVNMLVLRGNLARNPTVGELLAALQAGVLEALARQELPFEKLVEELQPVRSASYSPLAQIMFALQDELSGNLHLPGIRVAPYAIDTGTAKFDLTLTVMKSDAGLNCCAEYNTDLFEPGTIRRMLRHYQNVLNGMASGGPERRLSELPLLDEAERQQLLVEWNSTGRDYPRDRTLHDLFSAQAQQTPDTTAVVLNGATLSYRELDRRSNRLARHLRSIGVGPDCLVAIAMDRSIEMIVALIGTLKAGGAYVPVDLAYPAERIRFMLEDSKAAAILTRSAGKPLPGGLQQPAPRTICLDRDWPLIEAQSAEALSDEATPENLAYVIYTSGSTGQPKGVMIPHRAVVNLLHAMKREPGLRHDDTLLSVTSISFDIAALEIFLPLISGARIVLADAETIFDGARLIELIGSSGATVMQATPSLWRFIVDSGWSGRRELRVLCGGESLSRNLAEELLARSAGVWNLYGPTETTIWSTASRVDSGPGPVPIGRPIANTQILLLDRQLQPVPVGVPGELCIGGDGLARGYLNRPELTAAKFISNPFDGAGCSSRLYRTGDLARYRPDGTIECLGRLDDEVKLRGHRIDPGEIESILRQHSGIRDAVVVAREDGREGKQLVAYLVCDATPPDSGEVQRFVGRKLPDYMVPGVVVVLDRWPLTPNGKVDRKALPSPTSGCSAVAGASSPPHTAMEAALTAIWREVLQREAIGANDDFFRIGGHSLLAMQMASRVRKALHVDVSLRDIFESPTIASLARCLAQRECRPDSGAAPKPRSISPGQARSLLNKLDQLSNAEVEQLLEQLSPAEKEI